MDEATRLQRISEFHKQQAEIALMMLEQGIAAAIATDQPGYADKGQAQLPADHPWKQQLPTKEEVDEWAVAQATAAYECEKAKWPDERIRQFAQEVKDAQGK